MTQLQPILHDVLAHRSLSKLNSQCARQNTIMDLQDVEAHVLRNLGLYYLDVGKQILQTLETRKRNLGPGADPI